jgi:diguanylate cyclase (GGDEF)-like protein/PAS domain S-box-containing protein
MTLVALPEGFKITYDVIDVQLLDSIQILPFARSAEGNDVEGILVSDHVSGFSQREYGHGIFLESYLTPIDLPVDVVSLPVTPGDGFGAELIGVINAIHQGHETSLLNLQRGSQRIFSSLIAGLEECVLWTDENFNIIESTDSVTQVLGLSHDQIIGLTFSEAIRSDKDELHEMLTKRAAVRVSEKIDVEGLRPEGTKSYYKVGTRKVSKKRYQLNIIDITSQKESDKRFIQLSNYDPVTGLANRGLLFEFLNYAMMRSRRSETSVALLLLDIDHFKQDTDSSELHASDEILQKVSDRISHLLDDQAMLARWGGDELAIVLEDIDRPETVSRMAQKIMAVFESTLVIEGKNYFASTSIGIAIYPDADSSVNGLIQAASTAMYEARKETGLNSYRFYLAELQKEADERALVELHLRKALDNNEFEVYYQPKVSIKEERVIGFEALLRWQHPEWATVSPDVFIPIAEECGLINQIGDWVLTEACERMAQWSRENKQLADCSIAVNISAKQLADPKFASRVATILEAGLAASRLELELTESSVMEDPEEGICLLQKIHDLGVKISIDDFGTGYSSLSYLRKLPMDCVKIDRSFVIEIGSEQSAESIIHAILVLSSELGVSNVAEGVETYEQLAFFEGSHCDVIQGYYFSKPISAKEIEIMFSQPKKALHSHFEALSLRRN